MAKKHDDTAPISASKFMDELHRYKKGSVTRRHFLGVTGLGTAVAVMGAAMPSLIPSSLQAAVANKMVLSTWPNYHNPAVLEAFTASTGANIQANVFGSARIAAAAIHRDSPGATVG